jgi:hypothetical protein
VRSFLAVVLLGLLTACGGSGKTSSQQVAPPPMPRPEPGIRVHFSAQSHRPRAGKPWRYEVRVTDAAGKPVPAGVHLQILFAGVPVGQVGRHQVKTGIWQETIGTGGNEPFPARARGQPLVFQAVVRARGETRKVNWWIRVR